MIFIDNPVTRCCIQADDIEKILCHKFMRFMMMRAENFFILRRKPIEVRLLKVNILFIFIYHLILKQLIVQVLINLIIVNSLSFGDYAFVLAILLETTYICLARCSFATILSAVFFRSLLSTSGAVFRAMMSRVICPVKPVRSTES